MKLCFSHQRNQALTRTDVIVVVFVLFLVLLFLLLALPAVNSPKSVPISCISNLKQIDIAYRLWEGDNNNKYPMLVSVTNGGAMELVATGNVAACFQVMSNELSTPKILLCPEDPRRVWATNFSKGFDNSHISYFVGLDVTNETNPQMFLSGDDNFAIGGFPVKSGVLELSTNTPVTWTSLRHVAYNSHFWTAARHKFVGNIGMADGSVQQVTTDGLQKALQQTGVTTNRLVSP
jgi:prepilin-type processing-associated H-X9-DG protein